jgi:hypothetical protein
VNELLYGDCFAAHRVAGDRWELIQIVIEDDCYPAILKLPVVAVGERGNWFFSKTGFRPSAGQ